MRYSLLISIFAFFFIGCNKDKYSSVPQISFKSLKPDQWDNSNLDQTAGPILTMELTDAEGDFGDTSYAYIKNITIPPFREDSVRFPTLPGNIKKNMKVNVDVLLRR